MDAAGPSNSRQLGLSCGYRQEKAPATSQVRAVGPQQELAQGGESTDPPATAAPAPQERASLSGPAAPCTDRCSPWLKLSKAGTHLFRPLPVVQYPAQLYPQQVLKKRLSEYESPANILLLIDAS
uniref:Uncharacterized protein n=1 Tax=Molossus molossus TaxID=27622 RepID=A0A7J8GQX4_MOLMO|nr:hypothetical protein HJG59_011259 [Molossus molossus]